MSRFQAGPAPSSESSSFSPRGSGPRIPIESGSGFVVISFVGEGDTGRRKAAEDVLGVPVELLPAPWRLSPKGQRTVLRRQRPASD